jgi:hypothetical protein
VEVDSTTAQRIEASMRALPEYPGDADLEQMAGLVFGANLHSTEYNADLTVRLETAVAPLETNGQWDSTARRVTWPVSTALSDSCAHPLFCVAKWVAPDSARQLARFGAVRLTGERLERYCNWYGALTPEERGRWERMMATVTPGDLGPIERFRFPPGRFPGTDRAQTGREAILGVSDRDEPPK